MWKHVLGMDTESGFGALIMGMGLASSMQPWTVSALCAAKAYHRTRSFQYQIAPSRQRQT